MLSTVMGEREQISPPGIEGYWWELLGRGEDEELSLSFRYIV